MQEIAQTTSRFPILNRYLNGLFCSHVGREGKPCARPVIGGSGRIPFSLPFSYDFFFMVGGLQISFWCPSMSFALFQLVSVSHNTIKSAGISRSGRGSKPLLLGRYIVEVGGYKWVVASSGNNATTG